MPRPLPMTLPLEPLMRMSGAATACSPFRNRRYLNQGDQVSRIEYMALTPSPKQTLAELIGVGVWTIDRWGRRGIPLLKADAAAVACGLHPVEVWGDAFHEAWDAFEGERAMA